jgi:putative endonuclease
MDVAIPCEKQPKRHRREWKRNLIERQSPEWNNHAVGLALKPRPFRPAGS